MMSTTAEQHHDQENEAERREAGALDAYSRVVVDVAERIAPSVANLRVMRRGRSGGQVPAGAGSAVALTPDGFLVTSAHVVAGPARSGRATFVDGNELSWRVVGVDRLTDLAVLRADGDGLMPVARGGAEELRVGRPGARGHGEAQRRALRGGGRQSERVRRVGHGRRRVGARTLPAGAG